MRMEEGTASHMGMMARSRKKTEDAASFSVSAILPAFDVSYRLLSDCRRVATPATRRKRSLPRLELNPRDRDLLASLGRYQALTIDQFARIIGTTDRTYPSRVLKRAVKRRLVEHCHVPGYGWVYRLTDDGVALGQSVDLLDETHVAKTRDWKGEIRLGSTSHDVIAVDTMISLVQSIDKRPWLELLEIETDIRTVLRPESDRRPNAKTPRKFEERMKVTEEPLPNGKVLIVDWRVLFENSRTGKTASIRTEIDCDSYKKSEVAKKWDSYDLLFSERSRWAPSADAEFVLFATTSPGRMRRIMENFDAVACPETQKRIRFAHITASLHSDFLGENWQKLDGTKVPLVANGASRS